MTTVRYTPVDGGYLRRPGEPATRGAPRCRSRCTSWPGWRWWTGLRWPLSTEYRYHHGYWDGVEREFRGFGLVEQLDTETCPAAGGAFCAADC